MRSIGLWELAPLQGTHDLRAEQDNAQWLTSDKWSFRLVSGLKLALGKLKKCDAMNDLALPIQFIHEKKIGKGFTLQRY